MSLITTTHLKDYQEPDFKLHSVNLTFDLFEEYALITNVMEVESVTEGVTEMLLNTIDLELVSLKVNGEVYSYSHANETLCLENLPKTFTLAIENRIYPAQNTELEGLYQSGAIFCTQNEPEGFRRITPYLDRPDVMSIFTTTIIAEKIKYPILLSNGNQASDYRALENGRHSVTWHDPHPKPAHLFALVAGDLGVISDEFTTASGNDVALNIYCDLGNESKCTHAMQSLKEAMVWDEEQYGREYDLDIYNIVAVDSFNMGAMENKGLNIFNTAAVLANSDVATDANFMRIQGIIAHEYFHNWTGNRVGCKNWFQLTLKEGLTVFRDQCFSADLNSAEVQRIEDVKLLRGHQFVEDASPTAHPIQPKSYISMNNFYTATVYEKGAEVIRMIHTLIGEEAYKKAMDLYFELFDGKAVTTEDFVYCMSEASGRDLTEFKRWYEQSGTPTVKISEAFNSGEYSVTFEQIVPNTVEGKAQQHYTMPFTIGLIDMNGEEILEEKLVLSKAKETFSFKGLNSKPYLSANRDFSAPVNVVQEGVDYAFGMKHDQNSFSRYDSKQAFAIKTLEKIMQEGVVDESFVEAFGAILDEELDYAYKALLLELPSVGEMMQEQRAVEVEPIYEALELLSKTLAKVHKNKLLELYRCYHKPNNKKLDSVSMGERRLKNIALFHLSALDTEEVITLVKEQYWASTAMGDRVVALDIIENSSAHHSDEALTDFYEKYKENTLVMNKYIAILASSKRVGLLERVVALQKSEIYDEKVPNLVRALFGTFMANSKYFHAKDGSGYKFMAEKLLEIDAINAQISSRLAGGFKLYERMNEQNRVVMKSELMRVLEQEGISKNLYEIVAKIVKKED